MHCEYDVYVLLRVRVYARAFQDATRVETTRIVICEASSASLELCFGSWFLQPIHR